ncbi:MAG: protein-glutamate O-methyltransferase CheR [Nitrospirota bacterium]|jgi:chemotaxis protein methyltransferase CheR
MTVVTPSIEMSHAQFETLRSGAYQRAGIVIPDEKLGLVRSRVRKRLKALAMSDVKSYLDYLQGPSGEGEWIHLLDVLTTNFTGFFRESAHFDFLRDRLVPAARPAADTGGARSLRIWCAAAATGEEPYSIAMALDAALPRTDRWDVRILATDISTRALDVAQAAVYPQDHLDTTDPSYRQRYFEPGPEPNTVRVSAGIRGRVVYRRLNLMDAHWPLHGPLDAIFCRNAMIYFDAPTKAGLLGRFHALLAPGGYLFVGLSESLTGLRHPYRTVAPGIHQRPDGDLPPGP